MILKILVALLFVSSFSTFGSVTSINSLKQFEDVHNFREDVEFYNGLTLNQAIAYTRWVLSASGTYKTFDVKSGSASICDGSMQAYVLPPKYKSTIFLCNEMYKNANIFRQVISQRGNRSTDGEPVDEIEVLKRYFAAVLIHELLHLYGEGHDDRMYRIHDNIFKARGIENFLQAPHPELSSWAKNQLGL